MSRHGKYTEPDAPPPPVTYHEAQQARRVVMAAEHAPGAVSAERLRAAQAVLIKRGQWLSERQRASPRFRPGKRSHGSLLTKACIDAVHLVRVVLMGSRDHGHTPDERAACLDAEKEIRRMLEESW